ncbi:MAG TPA: CdaR family protein [Fimbriimonadaceae bacterium]|nr:CdaR family protein [Fimbriimonadaceae bacterium]
MKRLTIGNLLLGTAAIVVALMMWLQVSVQTEPSKQREFDVRLRTENLAEDLIVTSIPATVTVVADGSPEDLDAIKSESIDAVIDLSRAKAETRKFGIRLIAPTRFANLLTLNQPTVRLAIQRRKSAEFGVEVERFGALPRDVVSDSKDDEVEPQKVIVTGPEQDVDRVRRVVGSLDLKLVREKGAYPTEVRMLDEDGKIIPTVRAEPKIVRIIPSTSPAPADRVLLIVPDFVGQPGGNFRVATYEITPTQVSVNGPPGTVSRYSTIKTEPIDLSGMRGRQIRSVRLILPADVKLVRNQVVRVRVTIEPIPTNEIPPPEGSP